MSDTVHLARVTVVTVAYNSLTVIESMLESVPSSTDVIVVDNASTSPAPLAEIVLRHGARLIRSDENLGFGAGCNLGAEHASTEFLLFLNPDARLEPGAIEALVRAADAYPEASAFNPAIMDSHGEQCFKRRSVLLPRTAHMDSGWPAKDCEVPILSGAAMLVRRAAFHQVQGFDPNIFLYHEDDDLALRLKTDVGPLMFVADAVVSHDTGNSSIRTHQTAALKGMHMGRSRVYAARKHNVPGAATKAVLTALTQLASPLTLFSRRKRVKQMAFLRGVLSTLHETSPS